MLIPSSSLVQIIDFCSSFNWGIFKIVHASDLQKTDTDIAIPDKSQIYTFTNLLNLTECVKSQCLSL
jgi:hypothetical protein